MLWSVHPIVSSPSEVELLTLFPGSIVGSFPCQTVLQELLQQELSPWASVLHKLLICGSLPGDQSFRNSDPAEIHKSCQQTWHGLLSPQPTSPHQTKGNLLTEDTTTATPQPKPWHKNPTRLMDTLGKGRAVKGKPRAEATKSYVHLQNRPEGGWRELQGDQHYFLGKLQSKPSYHLFPDT